MPLTYKGSNVGVTRRIGITVLLWSLLLPAWGMAPDARNWLMKMTQARQQASFEGVFVYSRGNDMTSMRILHRNVAGLEQERLIALDGDRREIVRTGDQVICVFPDQRQVALRQALPGGPFGGAILGVEPMDKFYDVNVVGTDRVAGVEAVELALMARDAWRYSYRLWLEKQTGLLVKSLILDHDGDALEHFHFTSLTLDPVFDDKAFQVPDGRQVVQHVTDVASAQAEGPGKRWAPGWLPDGFVRATTEISGKPDPMDTLAQTYSDGLAALTIFAEPADEAMPEGGMRMGASVAYTTVRRLNGDKRRITVVGEVPLATARKIALSVGEAP
ncbi:MAG: transcriptional regulator [Gammaproteobacteria bacterium]|nr:MAG: transcriptional regulator [Gammaproteobacteria bacterium]